MKFSGKAKGEIENEKIPFAPRDVPSRQIQEQKCPIDAHCYRHCRRDPRIQILQICFCCINVNRTPNSMQSCYYPGISSVMTTALSIYYDGTLCVLFCKGWPPPFISEKKKLSKTSEFILAILKYFSIAACSRPCSFPSMVLFPVLFWLFAPIFDTNADKSGSRADTNSLQQIIFF